jgi:glycine/D-amino acid oxidase-like deaminating enzyme
VNQPEQSDVVVVVAGFSGLYLLHRLRELGFSIRVFDSAPVPSGAADRGPAPGGGVLSMAAAGCWAIWIRTIRCAGTCVPDQAR